MNEYSLLIDLLGHQQRQGHSQMARELIAQEKQEYKMYLQYKKYYSYGFFVARKI